MQNTEEITKNQWIKECLDCENLVSRMKGYRNKVWWVWWSYLYPNYKPPLSLVFVCAAFPRCTPAAKDETSIERSREMNFHQSDPKTANFLTFLNLIKISVWPITSWWWVSDVAFGMFSLKFAFTPHPPPALIPDKSERSLIETNHHHARRVPTLHDGFSTPRIMEREMWS